MLHVNIYQQRISRNRDRQDCLNVKSPSPPFPHKTPKALSALSKHKWLFADPLLLLSRHASVASISEIYCVGPCLQQSLPRRPQPHPNPGSCDPLAGCSFHSGTLENNLERVKRTSSRTANNVSPPSLCALHQSKLTMTCTLRWLLRVGERAAKACML